MNALPLIIRQRAVEDARTIRAELKRTSLRLAQQFVDELKDALARIVSAPRLYGVYWESIRAVRLRRFQHVVFYIWPTAKVLQHSI